MYRKHRQFSKRIKKGKGWNYVKSDALDHPGKCDVETRICSSEYLLKRSNETEYYVIMTETVT